MSDKDTPPTTADKIASLLALVKVYNANDPIQWCNTFIEILVEANVPPLAIVNDLVKDKILPQILQQIGTSKLKDWKAILTHVKEDATGIPAVFVAINKQLDLLDNPPTNGNFSIWASQIWAFNKIIEGEEVTDAKKVYRVTLPMIHKLPAEIQQHF